MTPPRSLPELMDYRYADRGGWRGFVKLVTAELPYDIRMQNVKDQYRVSLDQAKKWYGRYKKLVTL